MAASIQTTRSISLPSRTHPTSFKIEQTVQNLKTYDLSSASTSGSRGGENIQFCLVSLVELYGHVQELVRGSSTQQALLRHDQGKLVEEALDGSVALLDTCSSARDLFLRFKEQVGDLQSALRRKGCSSIESELRVYAGFRKKMAKDVARCLKSLKQAEAKFGLAAPLLDLDTNLATMVKVLREVHDVTVGVFRSLFLFLSMPTKATGWSLLSKLVTKRGSGNCSNRSEIFNEVAGVDLVLHGLDHTNVDVQLVRGRLQALDASIRILEGELDSLFRCLVENRVSLLNILTY